MEHTSLYSLLHALGSKPSALAVRLGVHKSLVSRWNKGKVPAERVLAVSGATGIAPHVLRPDVFPAPVTEKQG